jgi:hypothetical protein
VTVLTRLQDWLWCQGQRWELVQHQANQIWASGQKVTWRDKRRLRRQISEEMPCVPPLANGSGNDTG